MDILNLVSFLIGLVAIWVSLAARKRIRHLEKHVAELRARLQPGDGLVEPEQQPDPLAESGPWVHREQRVEDQVPDEASPALPAKPRTKTIDMLVSWLRDNWIYPTAGVALVLSGVFLVQYAVETGRMTPQTRVLLALVLAALLTAAGEWLRRRPLAGATLPATLTGAGLVIAMASILAALHLYQMITPAIALVALALLSLVAIVLGWLHGPMLSALGLVAGTCVPFVLGGGGPPPPVLFGYFALLAFAGLAIDALRRWRWVTWLAIIGPMGAIVLWRIAGADPLAMTLALVLVAGAAMTLPFGFLAPLVDGARALGRVRPGPGVRASFTASGIAALAIALLVPGLAGPSGLMALAGLIAIWCKRAPALADQMVLPVLTLPIWIALQAWTSGPVYAEFAAVRLPESAMPLQPSLILCLSLLGSLAMLWRSEAAGEGGSRHAPFTMAALLLPAGAMVALETTWVPASSLGAYAWALHAMVLAGLAVALTLHYGQRDSGQGPRLGAAAASAFALVAFGLVLLLGQVALTIALAVLIVAAAAMDRRLDIPALGAFLMLASVTLGWRLVVDPGLGWHLTDASILEMFASLLATLLGPFLALWLLQAQPAGSLRDHSRLVLETGMFASAAIGSMFVIARVLPDQIGAHAQLGLQASILIALAWVQVRRAALPTFQRVRKALAWLLGLAAAAALVAAAVYPVSPLFGSWPFIGPVAGWPVLNDLLLAYLFPAVLLVLLSGWRSLRLAGCGLGVLWVMTAMRHIWQGSNLHISLGVAQGELYAYTFALLLAGAVALGWALMTARSDLRKLGLVLAGLAAAKAFLVDASELDGLLRVGAFLCLGLTLAGLAWLNGWAVARERGSEPLNES